MQADEEFRSRLREDLAQRPQPPVGTLAADALHGGQRLRRRQRTARAVSGVAAVAVVAVGSVTLAGAFGSDAGSAVGPGGGTPNAAPKTFASSTAPVGPPPSGPHSSAPGSSGTVQIPSTWTSVQPATKVANPEWVTPRAIVAEMQKLLPSGAATSDYSGDYAYGGGDPRIMWAVDGKLTVTTAKGQAGLRITLHKYDGIPAGGTCSESCASRRLADGTLVTLQHDWQSPKGAYVMVVRPDGMSVQATTDDVTRISDDQLFALAGAGDFGGLKMDKAFVQHAESTVKGDFMNPPA
ncbi:hypothetical protein [Catenulispora subtropica]|uniref:Lipoprotein n=1 Tax=Catenulispora subtropica TaxID=450798 RepID=A0ABN2T205_9ACTN